MVKCIVIFSLIFTVCGVVLGEYCILINEMCNGIVYLISSMLVTYQLSMLHLCDIELILQDEDINYVVWRLNG